MEQEKFIAKLILPRDSKDLMRWKPGTEVTPGMWKVIFVHLGEETDEGKMAMEILREQVEKSIINTDTYAQIHGGFKNLFEALESANKKSGGTLLTEEDVDRFSVPENNGPYRISYLTREKISQLILSETDTASFASDKKEILQ